MKYPIYIPSKGRPHSKLMVQMQVERLDYRVFVEPQDRPSYKDYCTHQLDLNNQGMAYVRNEIINYAERAEHTSHFWMLDDDIEGFYRAENGKNIPISAEEALETAEPILELAGQGALEYSQFSWAAKPGQTSQGSYCDVCVLVNRDMTVGMYYRGEVNLKEDRDFTLQVLAAGLKTKRVSWLSFGCPENGSNKGGLYEEYRAGKEKTAAEKLAQLWPHCVTVQQKRNGRVDAKIDWRNVLQSKMSFA